MKYIERNVDLCIVGGGLSGLCAAIAAARHGSQVIIMQDRPVLGGNASSEIRMHICGADRGDGKTLRESGIIEEIELENMYRNPLANFPIWDSVLYSIARKQENLTLLLNCSCNDATMDNNKILSIKGWQGTAETWHTVNAKIFADCSGDSILATLTGAEFRIGREASAEFNESIEPEQADKKTMGMSCLIQIRENKDKVVFTPPDWAMNIKDSNALSLAQRGHSLKSFNAYGDGTNFWWLELGGENDSIHDTESLRDELLSIGFGIWDHIKNHGDHDADNYSLEWIGFLPGKRESRRYVGDHILNQNDVSDEGRFDDMVAYGGWSMDDHHPAGFRYPGQPTIFHPAPQPYGIPYRSLYSKNIENLMFAGRNISASHAAMSSTRVMGTCAVIGQAMGTAAAIAIDNDTTPRGVYKSYIKELQNTLMEDDCWLPWHKKEISELTLLATITSDNKDEDLLINGLERNFQGKNDWKGNQVTLQWQEEIKAQSIRIVFDSELERIKKNMPHAWLLEQYNRQPPKKLARDFDIKIKKNGVWETVCNIRDNYKRLVAFDINCECDAVKIEFIRNWGDSNKVNMYSFEVK